MRLALNPLPEPDADATVVGVVDPAAALLVVVLLELLPHAAIRQPAASATSTTEARLSLRGIFLVLSTAVLSW